METLIVLVIVGLAAIYLVKRYLRIFRPQAEADCSCGCDGCGQAPTCTSDPKSIQPRP
jgi:hypothetical protein